MPKKELTLKDFYEGDANLLVKFQALGPGWLRGHVISREDIEHHSVPGDPIDVQRWLSIDAVELTDESPSGIEPPVSVKNFAPAPGSVKETDHLPPAQQPPKLVKSVPALGSPQRPITAADRVAASKAPVRSTSRLNKPVVVKKAKPEPQPEPEANSEVETPSELYVETETIEPESVK